MNQYLVANPDVANAVAQGNISNAFTHYALYGSQEGRLPEGTTDVNDVSPEMAAINDKLNDRYDGLSALIEDKKDELNREEGWVQSNRERVEAERARVAEQVAQLEPNRQKYFNTKFTRVVGVGTDRIADAEQKKLPRKLAEMLAKGDEERAERAMQALEQDIQALEREEAELQTLRNELRGLENSQRFWAQEQAKLVEGTSTLTVEQIESMPAHLGHIDEKFYLDANPDVKAVDDAARANWRAYVELSSEERDNYQGGPIRFDPNEHFLTHGASEGRKPWAAWNDARYLALNPDVAAAVNSGQTTAIQHFIQFGLAEGRQFL